MPEGGGGDGGEVPALIPDGEPLREEVPAPSGGTGTQAGAATAEGMGGGRLVRVVRGPGPAGQ